MIVERVAEWIVAVLLVAGTLVAVLGVAGILRMRDPYTRAQAAAKPATLGLALVFLAVAIHFAEAAAVVKSLGTIAFAFLSIPIGAHMITRALHESGVPIGSADARDELREQTGDAARKRNERDRVAKQHGAEAIGPQGEPAERER